VPSASPLLPLAAGGKHPPIVNKAPQQRASITAALKEARGRSARRRRRRLGPTQMLMVSQIALSLLLVIGADPTAFYAGFGTTVSEPPGRARGDDVGYPPGLRRRLRYKSPAAGRAETGWAWRVEHLLRNRRPSLFRNHAGSNVAGAPLVAVVQRNTFRTRIRSGSGSHWVTRGFER